MATNRARPARDDEPLSDADRAAIDRALAEPGITLSADELAALLAADGDDEVRNLLAAGKVTDRPRWCPSWPPRGAGAPTPTTASTRIVPAEAAHWQRLEEREFGRLAQEADHLFDTSLTF